MHSPCRPTRVLAQRLLYLGVRVAGSAVLPGERGTWTPPLPDDAWDELLQAWSNYVGAFDRLTLYRRPQAGRSGFAALLLRAGRGVGFARYHPDAERVQSEFGILSGVYAAQPESFSVARPVASGQLESGAWLLNESLPNYPLGAVRTARTRELVADEIGVVLAQVMPRPEGTPEHWQPAHGDLAPWNLRTLLSGAVRVIDWEDACYAPPGVDRLYGSLTAHTTFGMPMPAAAPAEAIDWILTLVRSRAGTELGDADQVVLSLLEAMTRQ